jgi:hypothetical protein
LGYSKGSVKRNVYSWKCLYLKKKIGRFQINSLMMYLKLLGKQAPRKASQTPK